MRLMGVEFRRKAEVGDIDAVPLLSCSHQEILWLDISVNQILRVDMLKAADQLISNHQNRFE